MHGQALESVEPYPNENKLSPNAENTPRLQIQPKKPTTNRKKSLKFPPKAPSSLQLSIPPVGNFFCQSCFVPLITNYPTSINELIRFGIDMITDPRQYLRKDDPIRKTNTESYRCDSRSDIVWNGGGETVRWWPPSEDDDEDVHDHVKDDDTEKDAPTNDFRFPAMEVVSITEE
jgi:hypothetical protein